MGEPLHILLIEDSKSDAELTQEMLKNTGIEHTLTWLRDGEKALQYLERTKQWISSSWTSTCLGSMATDCWRF